MRALIVGLLSIFFTLSASAESISLDPLLNKVTLQLSADQWVASKTALVSVSVSASLTDNSIEKLHNTVLNKLNQLSNKAEWHIVSYDRSPDKSGLESIQMIAQARLPNTELSGLRDKAKSISKPGETYAIDNVQFTPSEDELREANNALRQNIYLQAQAELARLNKVYPDQKYFLQQINFVSEMIPAPVIANVMMTKGAVANQSSSALAVGDKLHVYASVVLASAPDPSIANLIRK